MSKIKLGLIGCGGFAKSHAARFEATADRMDVVATADIVLEQAQAVADLLPNARAVTDYREILDDVDAVLLPLPHQLHHPIGLDCIKAGKHVLMEKPMANTRQECLDLIAASEQSDKVFMVAYVLRYHPLFIKFKEMLDSKEYGDVFQVSIWTEQYTYCGDGKRDWACSAKNLGGGQFFSHGCHYVDILMWYLGKPIRGTHMGTNKGTPWMEREGTSNVVMEFEDGVMGYHFGTWGARGTRLRYSVHAHCTEAMLELDFVGGKINVLRHGEEDETVMELESGKHTECEMIHFLDCIENNQTPITDARSSLEGLEVIWKLYEAEENNTIADLR